MILPVNVSVVNLRQPLTIYSNVCISDKELSSEAIEKLLLLKDFSIGPTDRRFIEVVGVKGLRYVYNLREKNAIIYK